MLSTIHNNFYILKDYELMLMNLSDLYPMKPRFDLAYIDRLISFIKELTIFSNTFITDNEDCDYYISKNLSSVFQGINVRESILYQEIIDMSKEYNNPIIITSSNIKLKNFEVFQLYEEYIFVNLNILEKFKTKFKYCLSDNILYYDNLINILIMVKNAGEGFKDILIHNMKYADYMTILDTGSTDGTVDIAKKVIEQYGKGVVYERSWKNFRDSRNELLELAGTKFAFNIMLDDTYKLNGNIREFLTIARSDDEADSYSLFIKNNFSSYSSNRISKPEKKLKYMYTIHEILEKNNNFEIPEDMCWIEDVESSYMNERTNNRKQMDLKLLYEEYENNPEDPRILYYLGETYLCLKDFDNAFKYYKKRVEHHNVGFNQEIQDSLYKMGTIAYFNLNLEWEKCEELYLRCFNFDKTRSESIYIISYHYDKVNDVDKAYEYLLKAYEISKNYKPASMNSKYKINKYEIQKLLLKYCLIFSNYELGLNCVNICKEYEKNYPQEDSNLYLWESIFFLCNKSKNIRDNNISVVDNNKHTKTICVVAPGGWDYWDGETLEKKGLGGSETWCIKFCEELTKIFTNYNITIFCNCLEKKIYNNVLFQKIEDFPEFVSTNYIDYCLISRYPEYTQLCIDNNVENIYIIFHDLNRHGEIIPISSNKLKKFVCLSDWHSNHIENCFPMIKNKITTLHYGIDVNSFPIEDIVPYSFIFPSFPNRDLLNLLNMFPLIKERYPSATLNVFCNLKLPFVQKVLGHKIEMIEMLLSQPGVTNHGWVNPTILKKYWSKSHVWFYPTNFEETFCRVALEAAASKTFAITTNVAALSETVGNRGVLLEKGDPSTLEWQLKSLDTLYYYLDNENEMNKLVQSNYEWSLTKNYRDVTTNLLHKLNMLS